MFSEAMRTEVYQHEKFKLEGLGITMKNAVFIIIVEGELKVGNIAIATPISSVPTSSINIFPTLGGTGEFAARIIAENIANLTSKGVIVILNLKEYTRERIVAAMNLAKKIISKEDR
ncbi:MAG: hypothetical protein ACP6IU_07200 [Candidatus Asgardarchaeia archaeon]